MLHSCYTSSPGKVSDNNIKDCESSKGVSYHLLLIADGNRQQLIHPLVLQGSKKKKNLCSSATSTISSQQLTFSSHLPHGQDPGQGIFITILKQVSFLANGNCLDGS